MNRQRGESKLGCILYLLFAAYAGYLMIVMIPMYYKNLDFKNEMSQVASSYSLFQGRHAKMIETLYAKAQELELPLKKSDIKVRRIRKSVEISASYEREVNFLFMKKKLKFHPTVNKPFYAVVR